MSTFTEVRERTRALGLFTAVSIGGAAIGLVAGGLLTQWFSWRWVMFVNVPIGLAVHRRRAPRRAGDPASDRADRRRRRPDLDPRHDRPGLRVRPCGRGRVEQRRDDHVVRRRGAAARRSSSSSDGRSTRSCPSSCSPTAPVRGRMPGGCFSSPGSWGRSSSLTLFLQNVLALQPAADRLGRSCR